MSSSQLSTYSHSRPPSLNSKISSPAYMSSWGLRSDTAPARPSGPYHADVHCDSTSVTRQAAALAYQLALPLAGACVISVSKQRPAAMSSTPAGGYVFTLAAICTSPRDGRFTYVPFASLLEHLSRRTYLSADSRPRDLSLPSSPRQLPSSTTHRCCKDEGERETGTRTHTKRERERGKELLLAQTHTALIAHPPPNRMFVGMYISKQDPSNLHSPPRS